MNADQPKSADAHNATLAVERESFTAALELANTRWIDAQKQLATVANERDQLAIAVDEWKDKYVDERKTLSIVERQLDAERERTKPLRDALKEIQDMSGNDSVAMMIRVKTIVRHALAKVKEEK